MPVAGSEHSPRSWRDRLDGLLDGPVDDSPVDKSAVDSAVTDRAVTDGAVPDGAVIDGAATEGAVTDGDGYRASDDGVIDWLAVMGSPEVPTASASSPKGRPDEQARGGASGAKPDSFDDDEDAIPMKRIASIAAALVVLYLVVTFVDVWLASGSNYEGEASAVVVLGAAQYNGEPSEALQGRLDHAATLYLDERVELVVVTGGGQADDITTEAKTGYNYLRDTASIPDEALRLEVDGDSTYSSLAAVARFLAQENINDVILVTDPYHAKRSQLIAEEVDLVASVSPTDTSVSLPRLARETAAVSVGRIVGFRRLDAYVDL